MDLWIFAVTYKFPELAKHCLMSGPVRREIVSVLKNSQTGLRWFLNDQNIPLGTMQNVIVGVSSSSSWERERDQSIYASSSLANFMHT